MTGFEPAASSSRTKRATGLRYIPKKNVKIMSLQIIELSLPKQTIILFITLLLLLLKVNPEQENVLNKLYTQQLLQMQLP